MARKPKTKEAQERIRRNVLEMESPARIVEGMQAVVDVVEVDFEEIHKRMLSHYRPKDYLEETLVRRIARCTWRLQVLETIEEHKLEALRLEAAPGDSLKELSVIERRTDVMLHRAIQALTAKRKQDRENMKNKLADLPPPGKWPRPAPEISEDSSREPHKSPGDPVAQPTPVQGKACDRSDPAAVSSTGTATSPLSNRVAISDRYLE